MLCGKPRHQQLAYMLEMCTQNGCERCLTRNRLQKPWFEMGNPKEVI